MPTSLKSLIPALSDALGGNSEGMIYERLRALIRAGLLEATPGRGPGSGVRATPESVAMLLIGTLAAVNWSETAAKTREIAFAKATTGECPLTGATDFKAALAAVLSNERLARRVTELRVAPTNGAAEIICGKTASRFAGPESDAPGMRITIGFGSGTVQALVKIVAGLPK